MASVPTKPPAAPRMRRVRQSERERKYIRILLTILQTNCRPLTKLGQDLPGVELEKAGLIWPDLVHPDVRITCLGGLCDGGNVMCGIRPTDNRLRDFLLSNG